MFCGPSATPWSPPPASGRTSPSVPSGSSDPHLQPRSLGSPDVMLSSGRCAPQTLKVKAKNISKLSTHLAICLHLTSSFWHCHPWKSHHQTRRKSKASPFQLLQVSPTHKCINIFPNQPFTIICSNEWVTCGAQETCKDRSKRAKTNVQTESKE